MGGDSVSAMRVVAAARRLGLSLTVEDIFKCQNLSELAARTHKEEEHETRPTGSIQPFSLLNSKGMDQVVQEAAIQCCVSEEMIGDIYPCTPLQAGMLALSEKTPGMYIMRFSYALSPSSNIDQFKGAWQKVAQENPILRTTYVQTAEADLLQVVLKTKIQWTGAMVASDHSSGFLGLQSGLTPGKPLALYTLDHNPDTGGFCFQ